MSFHQFEASQSVFMHPRLPKLRYVSSLPPTNFFDPGSIPAREESTSSTCSSNLHNSFNAADLTAWNAASHVLPVPQAPQLSFQNVDLSEGRDSELEEEVYDHSAIQTRQLSSCNDNFDSTTKSQTEVHAPKRQKKSTKKVKKGPGSDDEYVEEEEAVAIDLRCRKPRKTRGKKPGRPPKKDSSNAAKSPTRRPARLIRKKPTGIPLPKSLDEAGEADKMMWKWKNAGKNWDEIRKEWQRLTGHLPGHSTLSVRYIKLNENLARGGAATDHDLCRFKKEAETELMAQLWNRVAEKMLEHNVGSEHNPKELSKRYNMLVRSGFDPEELAKLEYTTSEETPMKSEGTNACNILVDEEAEGDHISACEIGQRITEVESRSNYSIGAIESYAAEYNHSLEGTAECSDIQYPNGGITEHHFQQNRSRFLDHSDNCVITSANPLVEYLSDSD